MRLILRPIAWSLLIGLDAGLLGVSSTAPLAQNLVDPEKGATTEEYLYESPQEYDPFESLNRQIYDFNQAFYGSGHPRLWRVRARKRALGSG